MIVTEKVSGYVEHASSSTADEDSRIASLERRVKELVNDAWSIHNVLRGMVCIARDGIRHISIDEMAAASEGFALQMNTSPAGIVSFMAVPRQPHADEAKHD